MKKLALPLVAAFALAACATTPAESTVPSPTASASTAASGLPLTSQAPEDIASNLSQPGESTIAMPGYWIAFPLAGSPADWTFSFSNPSIVEFHADGVINETGAYAGILALSMGETTITATNASTGERIEMALTIIN